MEIKPRLRQLLPPALLLTVFWTVAMTGLDFGVHWDETRAKFDSVQRSVETGMLIQSVNEPDGYSYNYGGVNYWLTWIGFTPEVFTYVTRGIWTQQALREAIVPVVYSMDARLRVRVIYVVLSGLTILWLYCLCLALGRTRVEAWLAAAILSLSWEVGYHSRWVAPDTVVMQFCVLCVLCMVIGYKRSSTRWFHASAVIAGLAAGTKYTAALLLPFLLFAVAYSLRRRGNGVRAILPQVALAAAVGAGVFVITTPGVILDPFRFFFQLRDQQLTYADGFFGYTVIPGISHLWAILQYFSFEGFSHFAWVSGLLALFALIGMVKMVFERRAMPLLICGFSATYLVFFSQQSTMLVRNYLLVIPFLALAAARGIVVVAEGSSKRTVYAVLAILLLVNFGWEIHAAVEIRRRGDFEYFVRQFEEYARRETGETFLASTKLMDELRHLPEAIPENITGDPRANFTKSAFLQSEGADEFWAGWPANQRGLYERTFGALEVNLDRYPTFVGNRRILVVSRAQQGRLPISADYLAAPDFALSTTAVVAGQGSYELRVKRLSRAKVVLRYSFEGGNPEEFAVTLKDSGEAHFDIGADARKGAYRFLAYRRASESNWFNVDATVTVK